MNTQLTKEQYLTLRQIFADVVNSDAVRPHYDPYGTKYQGVLAHMHFIIYAILRGRDPQKTTHDSTSESYQDELLRLDRALDVLPYGQYELGILMKPFSGKLQVEAIKAIYQEWRAENR